jgi:integrase
MRYHHQIIGGRLVLRSLVKPARSGNYHARIRDPRTGRMRELSTGERDKARAQRVAVSLAENWLEELQGGGRTKPRRFDDAYDAWLAELDVADSTRKEYELIGRVMGRHFRGHVHSVDRAAVKAFVARRHAEVSPRTVAKQLTQLRSFLRWSIREGYLAEDPTIGIKVKSGRPREGIALTHEEARQLLDAAQPVKKTMRDERRGDWVQAVGASYLPLFLTVALHTGLRKSNILRLKWTQVDLEKRRIEIPADEMKMRRRHVIPIHRELLAGLRAALRGRGSTVAYVLGKQRGDIRKAFEGAVKRSGLTYDLRIHDLRHTASTWLQMRLPFVMAEHLMSRQIKAVGNVYFHPSFDELLAAVDGMPWIAGEQRECGTTTSVSI